MLIVCPTCATSYRVQATAIGATGREVRCARCRTLWFAAGEAEVEEAWPEHDAAPAAAVAPGWAEPLPTVAGDPAPDSPVPEGDAPPLVPATQEEAAEQTYGVGVGEDIDSFAARGTRRYALLRRASWQP